MPNGDKSPAPRRHRLAREAARFAAFVALAALMTWPWAAHLRDAVGDTGDPYMIAWTLWWDYHQTFTDPLSLFHANVFYPYRYTLAFSEHDYGIAVLFFPLFALGLRPLTVHSVATFTGFAFCGYAAFRLARTLTGSSVAGWVAGIFFAFVPYRFSILSHLHYLFAGWLPLLLEALVLFARERSRRRAAWLAAAFAMNGLTCVTWMLLALVPLVPTLAYLVLRYRLARDRAFWLRGAAAALAAGLVLLPFTLPYHYAHDLYGFAWTRQDAVGNSPTAAAWLQAEQRNRLWRGLGAGLGGGAPLFPGLLAPLLALAALLLPSKTAGDDDGAAGVGARAAGRGDALWLGTVWAVCGFLLSLGMNAPLFRLLYDHVFLFRSQRIPARGAMLAYVGLCLLAGLGAAALARRARRVPARAVCLALCAALLFELRAAPLRFERGAVDPDELALRLRETPMRGGLLELPTGRASGYEHRYVLRAADHGRPLINGTSSFIPPIPLEVEGLTASGLFGERLLDLLEEVPASYVVLHSDLVEPERRPDYDLFFARAVAAGRLRFVRSFGGGVQLFAVVRTEPEARQEEPTPVWTAARGWDALLAEDPVHLLGSRVEASLAVYRLHALSYGGLPRMGEFLSDVREVARRVPPEAEPAGAEMEASLRDFAEGWAARPAFAGAYGGMGDGEFVDALLARAGLAADAAGRERLVAELRAGAATRGSVLRRVADDPAYARRERTRGLVLLYYFGYLRRNPDDPPDDASLGGYNFWVAEVEKSGDTSRLARGFRASYERGGLKR